MTLELEHSPADAAPFRPGQFNMLTAPGIGEVPISMSGGAAPGAALLHTVRAVGAVSRALVALEPGAWIGVRGPYGTSWPVREARGGDVVIVAGGIGLAPLRPSVRAILDERDQYGEVVLLYGARSPSERLFPGELEEWRGRGLEVRSTVDVSEPGWRESVGVVTTLLPAARFSGPRSTAFVCGPEIMMRFVAMGLLERGVAPERLFVSLERNMQCGIGLCGHCQLGPLLVCRDGPVVSWKRAAPWLNVREL
ncbi:MAG: FAD/NAD(P)-binding protein [Planctomycetota bacterium]